MSLLSRTCIELLLYSCCGRVQNTNKLTAMLQICIYVYKKRSAPYLELYYNSGASTLGCIYYRSRDVRCRWWRLECFRGTAKVTTFWWSYHFLQCMPCIKTLPSVFNNPHMIAQRRHTHPNPNHGAKHWLLRTEGDLRFPFAFLLSFALTSRATRVTTGDMLMLSVIFGSDLR